MNNKPIKRLLLLNQMAGILFRELAEGLSEIMPEGCTLCTGAPETLAQAKFNRHRKLAIKVGPVYDRRSMFTRVTSWLNYLVHALKHVWQAEHDTAIVIVSNPPIIAPMVWLLSFVRKRPYIVLVYDIYPDIAVRMGYISSTNPLTRLWRWINKRVYEQAQGVITIANHMAHHVSNQFDASKTPLGRVGVLFPWVDANKIKPLDHADNHLAKEYQTDGRMVVLYSGNLGISHDIGSMLRAAEILKDRSDILFLFIGGGAKWPEAKAFQARKQLSNVQVRSYVTEELLPQSMALSDISLVALDPGAEGMMIPSKLFYYMSAGAAVVGICGADNDLQEVVERADCGICVGHGEPERLADVIKSLADDSDRRRTFGRHARKAAVQEYTPEAGIAQCTELLRQSGLDFS